MKSVNSAVAMPGLKGMGGLPELNGTTEAKGEYGRASSTVSGLGLESLLLLFRLFWASPFATCPESETGCPLLRMFEIESASNRLLGDKRHRHHEDAPGKLLIECS